MCLGTLYFLLLAVVQFSAVTSYTQSSISPEVARIVSQIADKNIVQGKAVGYGGVRPQQYDNFVELTRIASTSELLSLTDHPNAVVRCYSFWALSERDSVDLFPIILKHLNDVAKATTQFGCIKFDQKVGDFFIMSAVPGEGNTAIHKLNQEQLAALDSILIFGSYDLYARDWAINAAEPRENLYTKIRDLVTNEQNLDALVTLAKYRKESDLELIGSFAGHKKRHGSKRSAVYRAINNFPHESLFPVVRAGLSEALADGSQRSEYWELYQAIASFENEEAAVLLENVLPEMQKSRSADYFINFMFSALRKHIVPAFENLLWKLWTEEKRITSDVFEHFVELRPDSTYAMAAVSLGNIEEHYLANISLIYEEGDSLGGVVADMLDYVMLRDTSQAYRLIENNLGRANVFMFPVFAGAAVKHHRKEFVEPLVARLTSETNPHIYLKAAEALISFKDKDINRRIIKVRAANKQLSEGWGGEALEKLLREHGLI